VCVDSLSISAVDIVCTSVYTQITDIELECDGIYTYDRISHYNAADTANIKAANDQLTGAASQSSSTA